MAVVKGSKQYPLKIVEYHPWRKALAIVVLSLLVAGSVYFSYQMGHRDGMAGQEKALSELSRLQVELQSSQTLAEDLQQRVTNLSMGAQIDRKASEDVRQEVIDLKDQLAQMEEENSFYRNLMAPTGNKRGLTFGSVEVIDTDKPREYAYKVVMQQLATNHTLLNGSLSYTVIGKLNGVDATFSLNQLSDDISSETIRLRFKYFQTIQGKMSLPQGFEPERIELVAKSTGQQAVTIEKRFGWLVEEALTHVPE